MRWLMIGLLVSLVVLLLAVAGMVRHVWLQRKQMRNKPLPIPGTPATHPPDAEHG